MNPETQLMRRIMLALSQAGCTVWRNETGRFWTGRVLHRQGKQVTLDQAAMIPVGLCKGSSDVIGIAPDGRLLAVEVKTKRGRATAEQVAFIKAVQSAGGVSCIARSVDEALALVADCRAAQDKQEDTHG